MSLDNDSSTDRSLSPAAADTAAEHAPNAITIDAASEQVVEAPAKPERIFLAVVDNSEEHHIALRFAARRARHSQGRVALVYVIEPNDQPQWLGVGELMKEEARQEAELTLMRHAGIAQEISGKTPVIFLREGNSRDQIIELLDEEPQISVIVLAAAPGGGNPGPLVSALSGKFLGRLKRPLTIIPGELSEEDIDAIS